MFDAFVSDQWAIAGLILATALFFGTLILALQVIEEKSKIRRDKAYWAGRKKRADKPQSVSDRATDQLKKVSEAKFVARPLLNRSESKVFAALDAAVVARNPNWQVMAQVSIGEFLASPDKDAFLAVNYKRVDFALMDENCCVRHALEYQGSGHHAGTSAAARDAVKKEALRKAGIGYHEVVAGHTTPGELKALVEKLVPSANRGTQPKNQLRDVVRKAG